MSDASRVVNSAFLSVAAKLLGKTLGLISTFIVARILAPEDFGFIAIVSMALYLFDIISHAAGEQYIVQKRSVSFYDVHSAWTLNLLLKSVIALLLVFSAPWVSAFFDKPDLSSAIMFSAIILPLQSLKSHKLLLMRRQLHFKPLFWLSLCERLLALPVLVAVALSLKSYWAFLFTDAAVALFGAVLSYQFVSGKPVLTLRKVKQQWAFSQWMLGKHLLGYVRSQIDTIVVAKFFSTSKLGNYHIARDLAMMPAHYLLNPAIEPLLAVFKNDRHNKAELLNNVSFSLFVVFCLSIPILSLLALFAKPLVFILLGSKWNIAATLLPVLSILFFYWCIVQVLEAALIAMDKVRFLFFFDVLSLLFIAVSLYLVIAYKGELSQLAWARSGVGISTAIVLLSFVFNGYWKHLSSLMALVMIIAFATLVAALPTYALELNAFTFDNPTLWQFVLSAIGAAVFCIIYAVAFIMFINKNQHYHVVRLKQLMLANLPNSFSKVFLT